MSARVFLTDDSFFEAMNDEYRRYFTTDPPARATAVARLMGNDASVEISLIAAESGKQVVGPAVAPSLPLSTARARRRFPVSCRACWATRTRIRTTSRRRRAKSFTRIRRTLDGVGLSFSHVVDNLVYVH